MNNKIIIILLLIIVSFGFWFRLQGIVDNHSFWADEAYIASVARDITDGKKNIFDALNMPGAEYQKINVMIQALFFSLLGQSEFSARLPSVIFGSLGIIFAYLLAARLSNRWGGLLAAFLYSFSSLNLAYATQAKPNTTLETLLLIICYLLLVKNNSIKSHFVINGLAIILLLWSSFMHGLGIIFWAPYLIWFAVKYFSIFYNKKLFIFFIISFLIIAKLVNIDTIILNLFKPLNGKIIFAYNNFMYLKNLMLRQYGIFFIPSLIGMMLVFKKNKAVVFGIGGFIITLFFMWNFRSYSHNIRYLLPSFGIMFVFFGVFWAKVSERIPIQLPNSKYPISNIIPILVILLLIITRYKIFVPIFNSSYSIINAQYFSPNTDFYGDVQIADYKTMYSFVKKLVPDYKSIAIFSNLADAQRYYMPEKHIDAYFTKGITKPIKHPVEGGFVYSSLSDFLKEKNKYPKGILIVEDWESFLPEDIKQYAKKNMKRIVRVEGLKSAPLDPWPLEVYEWRTSY